MFTEEKGRMKIDAASIAATFIGFGMSIPQFCFPLFLYEKWRQGRNDARNWKLS